MPARRAEEGRTEGRVATTALFAGPTLQQECGGRGGQADRERGGLVAHPHRDETVARLLFVRNAIRFGFTSKELAGFLKARDSGRPPCHSVRAGGQRLLKEMDEHLARLHEARAAMAETLAAWDARLDKTPAGAPAHLLTMVPEAPRAIESRFVGRRSRERRAPSQ